MCPGCCPGIGMGVTPTMNTHKGNLGIAVPCSRREHRAILPEPSSFREPGALWANRTVETARLVYKSNRKVGVNDNCVIGKETHHRLQILRLKRGERAYDQIM